MVEGLAAIFLAEVDEWHKEQVVRPAVARQATLERELQQHLPAASWSLRSLRRWTGGRLIRAGAWLSAGEVVRPS